MAKRLTEEEKKLRSYKQDDELLYVLKCKCGAIQEISIYGIVQHPCLKCKKIIYDNKKPYLRNCEIIYHKEG